MFSKIIRQKSDLHVYTYKIKRGELKAKWGITIDGEGENKEEGWR